MQSDKRPYRQNSFGVPVLVSILLQIITLGTEASEACTPVCNCPTLSASSNRVIVTSITCSECTISVREIHKKSARQEPLPHWYNYVACRKIFKPMDLNTEDTTSKLITLAVNVSNSTSSLVVGDSMGEIQQFGVVLKLPRIIFEDECEDYR